MDYYFLDLVPWQLSQTLYHAAAHLGREALFILRPASPYICLGFHQDVDQEIDLEFARSKNLPIFRREVGGGAVYLDQNQLFYQLILRSNRPEVPVQKSDFYRKFLQPVIETYRAFGLPAEYKPINDILVHGKKISGNGAAELGDVYVLVGNFILDFDYEMMSRVLRTPEEKFRDKLYKTLRGNLTSLRREVESVPSTIAIAEDLYHRYENLLGNMNPKPNIDSELLEMADMLFEQMFTDEWLFQNTRRRQAGRQVKIRTGVDLMQNIYKAPGGLIRLTALNDHGLLRDVHLSGDFFFYPASSLPHLESVLEGLPVNRASVSAAVARFFDQEAVEVPGIRPEDFAAGLLPQGG